MQLSQFVFYLRRKFKCLCLSFPSSPLYLLIGDNMLTAISVARDCGMVRPCEKVIIADAGPPKDFQPASITWHYTENQAQAVKDNEVRTTE